MPTGDGFPSPQIAVDYGDKRPRFESGDMGGFEPGSEIKLFCWESPDGKWLHLSVTSKSRRAKVRIKNPFEDMTYTCPIAPGTTAGLNKFLMRGTTANIHYSDQEPLRSEEVGLSVTVTYLKR